jgi:hypothetical protein
VRLEGQVLVMTADWFDRKVRPFVLADEAGCWLWQRYLSGKGYGQVTVPGVGHQRVHRVVYEHFRGPIATGLYLDHLCRVAACCRPDHLEPVTNQVNLLRGATVNAEHASRTHCPEGHELAPGNLIPSELRQGRRKCATCGKRRDADKAAAIRAAHSALGLTVREYTNRFGWSSQVAREVVRRLDAGEPLDGVRDIAPGSGRWGRRTITIPPDPTRA